MPQQKITRLGLAITLAFLVLAFLFKSSVSQNYEQTYLFIKDHSSYRLAVSVTPSLLEYYQQKGHQLTQESFASFVTPYSMAPMATDIRSIFVDEEDFVNAVLMLVHQIPYEVVAEPRYPAETIVENMGDCDLLSFVAASLVKSQDLEVVLFFYPHESHMNIGVSLPTPPRDVRTEVSYIDCDGSRYYVAECTGNDWQNGWRIGECPSELEGAQVTVVTLENCEQIAPGQVSSSFDSLESSVISLSLSSGLVMEGSLVVMSGQVSAPFSNGSVTLYVVSSGEWIAIGTVSLNSGGHYTFYWTAQLAGRCYAKASWSGDAQHAGADSEIVPIYVIPKILVFMSVGLFTLGMVGGIVLLLSKAHSVETKDLEQASDCASLSTGTKPKKIAHNPLSFCIERFRRVPQCP